MGDKPPRFELGSIVVSKNREHSLHHVTQRFSDIDTGYMHYVVQPLDHSDETQIREDNMMCMYENTSVSVDSNVKPIETVMCDD